MLSVALEPLPYFEKFVGKFSTIADAESFIKNAANELKTTFNAYISNTESGIFVFVSITRRRAARAPQNLSDLVELQEYAKSRGLMCDNFVQGNGMFSAIIGRRGGPLVAGNPYMISNVHTKEVMIYSFGAGWSSPYTEEAYLTFGPESEVQKILEIAASNKQERVTVAYCRKGVQTSITYETPDAKQ